MHGRLNTSRVVTGSLIIYKKREKILHYSIICEHGQTTNFHILSAVDMVAWWDTYVHTRFCVHATLCSYFLLLS